MESRKPLTPCQKELLNKTRNRGMTEDLLQSWTPEPNVYRNVAFVASEANPEEQQAVEDVFTNDHAAAVEYLMHHQKLSAEQAIEEVRGITPGEARFLVIAYKNGVRGETLRNINTEKCTIDSHEFHEAFRYLVGKQKYSADDAIRELDNLTPFQVRMLHELYPYGLRARHIHAVLSQPQDLYDYAFDNYGTSKKFRAYFNELFTKAINKIEIGEDVIQEALRKLLYEHNCSMEETKVTIFKVPVNRAVNYLRRNPGLFAKQLPEHFSAVHQRLFTFMKRKGHDLIQEMDDLGKLDAVAAELMLKYYNDGVRAHHLIALNGHNREHLAEIVSHLVKSGQPPVKAMEQLAEMSPDIALAMLQQSANNDNNTVPKM